MKLTICLLTKGRKEYLEDALSSYEKFIDTGNVDVILFDNGSDLVSKQILLNWKLKFDQKVSYIRNEVNNPGGFTIFWDQLKTFNPDWILNPGDDDILVFDVYQKWVQAVENNPSLNAFASSAEIIDSSGRITGEIRIPSINGISDQIKLISNSIHQPPFFWPSLIFKFSAIPTPVIHSRFTHDWWIGLHLILKSQIQSTESIGVKYRVHKNQESFQSSNRRKFFEGYNMLITVFNSEEFKKLLESITSSEIERLLDLCIINKPLYSQPEYYLPLIRDLATSIIKVKDSNLINSIVAEKYILSAAIYTKMNDLENIYTGLDSSNIESPGNIAVTFSESVCKNLLSVEKFFNKNMMDSFQISCKHSKFYRGSTVINCEDFDQLEDFEIADVILLSLDKKLENNGVLNFTMTPFEREMINFYRNLKLKIPNLIKTNLIRIKKFIGEKNEI